MSESFTNNQPKNQYDVNGKRSGYWEEEFYMWNNSTEIKFSRFSKGNYVNNIRRGYWESFIESDNKNKKELIYYL